jgi:hypothetical protein
MLRKLRQREREHEVEEKFQRRDLVFSFRCMFEGRVSHVSSLGIPQAIQIYGAFFFFSRFSLFSFTRYFTILLINAAGSD